MTLPAIGSHSLGFKGVQLVKGKHVKKTPGGGVPNPDDPGSSAPPPTSPDTSTETYYAADRIIDLDGKAFPAVKAAGEQPTGVPAFRVRLGGQRTWLVHTPNDIPALIEQTIDLAASKAYTYPPSSTPPTSPTPQDGDLWPDTSTGVTIMRRYDSGSGTWVAVTEIGTNVRLIAIGSLPQINVAGNSFKRDATGTDYNHAVYADVQLANSAYVRCGATASGNTAIGLDQVNTETAQNSQDWLFEVTVSNATWTLRKAGTQVDSGDYGASVPVDTNIELRYSGDKVEAIIGSTTVASQTETPNKVFFAKIWAKQQGSVHQIAAGYSGVDSDPYATIGDNYAVDPYFSKPGTPDYTLTNFAANSSLPTGAPAATGVSCTTSTGTISAIPNGSRFPCAPNQLLSIGCYLDLVKSSGSATPDLTIKAEFYNSSGTLISTSPLYTEAFASATSGWVWRDHVVITPANTASVACIVSFADKGSFTAYVTGFRIGRTQAAADVSMWVEGTPQHRFQYDSAGVALAGEFPKAFVFALKTLLGTVTSGVAWSYLVQEGTVNGFTVASGSKSMTGTSTGTLNVSSLGSSSATVQITATYGGIARDTFIVKFEKFLNPPQSGGSTGGSGGTMPISKSSGFNSFSGTTFVDITGIMSGTMPSGKTTANIAGELYARPNTSGQSDGDGWNIEMKAQRNTGTAESPIWTDKGALRSSSSNITDTSGGEPGVPPRLIAQSSTHTFNESEGSLTGGTIYDWKIVGRINPTGSTNTTNTHTVTGSITISAP